MTVTASARCAWRTTRVGKTATRTAGKTDTRAVPRRVRRRAGCRWERMMNVTGTLIGAALLGAGWPWLRWLARGRPGRRTRMRGAPGSAHPAPLRVPTARRIDERHRPVLGLLGIC